MSPESVFRWCNLAAIAGWTILVFFGRRRWAASLATGVGIAGLLSGVYLVLLAAHFGEGHGGFGSLAGVQELFSNHWVLLAGWVHYLAFDLFIGSWQVRDAERCGIAHWITIPSLLLTFWFGPIGLLLYFAIRVSRTRSLRLAV